MSGRLISISGPPGSGKSTLALSLSQYLGWQLVEFDRFETMTQRNVADVDDWLARGAPYEEITAPGLRPALEQALQGSNVIFDTPLGRAGPLWNIKLDYAVWIDCPPDVALARKIRQIAGRVTIGQEAGFRDWLIGFLQAHEKIVRPAVEIQRHRVRELCDLKVAAGIDTASQTQIVLEALEHEKFRAS